MKKHLFIITAALFNISICFSQNGAAYQSAKATNIQGLNPLQLARLSQQSNYERQLQRASREPYYANIKKDAVTAFNRKDYNHCIYLYESSKKMGFYNGEFEYMAGVSYHKLAEQTNDKKLKTKAKSLLKKAKKHGYVLAAQYLNRNF